MITGIVRALVAAGATPEMILAAVEAYDQHTAACYADETARVETKRANDRERQRRHRASQDVTVTERDSALVTVTVSPKEIPPAPPKETTPSVSSLRSETISFEARASAPESGCRVEFAMTFWPAYPHKVGQRKALTAFIAARQRAPLLEIMDGLARYVQSRPPDRQWLNPANFLDEDRWNDEPASTEPAINGKSRPHDAIFGALADIAAEGVGPREWQADSNERPPGITGPAPGDRPQNSDLDIPAYLRRTA